MSLEGLPLSSSNCNSVLMGGERGSVGSAFCPPHSPFCDSVLLSISPPPHTHTPAQDRWDHWNGRLQGSVR